MLLKSDDKVIHRYATSFLNLSTNISESETEINFENYSNIHPIFAIKTISTEQKAVTSDYKKFVQEDAVILNAIADGFKRIDKTMANGMEKKK